MSRIASVVAASDDIESEDVPVAQWQNITLRLKSMDLLHRGAYLERMIKAREEEDDQGLAQIQAELVVHCAFDPEDDSLAFTAGDIPMLLTKHGGIVGMLASKASRLSGLDAEAEERLGKGSSVSSETQSADSSSL